MARELVAHALAAHRRQTRRGAPGGLDGVGLGQQVEAARQPEEAQHAQRVVVERRRRAQPQAAGGEVVEPAERVDELAAVQRPRQRVHGDVAAQQIGLQTSVARRRRARLPGPGAAAPRRRARRRARCATMPNASDEANTAPPSLSASARAKGSGVAVEHDVDVADGQAEQLVAQAAADEPAGLAAAEHGRAPPPSPRRVTAAARPLPAGALMVTPRVPRRGSGAPPAATRRRRSRS